MNYYNTNNTYYKKMMNISKKRKQALKGGDKGCVGGSYKQLKKTKKRVLGGFGGFQGFLGVKGKPTPKRPKKA